VQAYATWAVMGRLRRRAEAGGVVRTATAKIRIGAAVRLAGWLDQRQLRLGELTQRDIEVWLAADPPSSYDVRDFLRWASERKLVARLEVPALASRTGSALEEEQRWQTPPARPRRGSHRPGCRLPPAALRPATQPHRRHQGRRRDRWRRRGEALPMLPRWPKTAITRCAGCFPLPHGQGLCRSVRTSLCARLQAGVPVKVVSERLGHKTTAITENLYLQVIPQMAEEAATTVANLILGNVGSRPSVNNP
jgi:hypothetical protein